MPNKRHSYRAMGLSGTGKSTITGLETKLDKDRFAALAINCDLIGNPNNNDLTFNEADRNENTQIKFSLYRCAKASFQNRQNIFSGPRFHNSS